MRLTDFKALTFDCYGTLINWEAGMIEALKPLTTKVKEPLTRDQVLESHARNESAQQRQTPGKLYRDLLPIIYKRLAEEWGVPVTWDDCAAYGRSVGDWPAFDDSATALQYLKKHYKLVILSNVDNQSFAASNKRLGVTFDAVYTAEDVGSYKPDPRNFDYMLANIGRLDIERHQILHTAESLFHDHAAANKAGLTSAWIFRRHDQKGSGATMPVAQMPRIDFKFTSMAELVKAHEAELRGSP
jgi:putative hydrolase of the HAD superfamily